MMCTGTVDDDDLVTVKVIDRIKEDYLEAIENKMNNKKGVDSIGPTVEELREKAE